METKAKKWVVNTIGALLLFLGVMAIAVDVLINSNVSIFWFCYIGLILLGIGILLRNSLLMVAQLNILIIPAIIWDIDFSYLMASGKSLWGLTPYFFAEMPILKVISLQHIYAPVLALISLGFIKIKSRHAWLLSVFEVVSVFLICRAFTTPKSNVNCVWESCFPVSLIGPQWFQWFLAMLVIILVTNTVLNVIPIFKKVAR